MSSDHLPEPDAAEIDDRIGQLAGSTLPRRTPRLEPSVRVELSEADPLWIGIHGGKGAYVVRRVLAALGFDEHRIMALRLEHKLVFAKVFERYCPGALPKTWGLGFLIGAIGPHALPELLKRGLPPAPFIKATLGCLSGDYGEGDASLAILSDLERGVNVTPPGPAMADEAWIVQERIPIAREYRVHTMEDSVLLGFTSLRYAAGIVPDDHSVVEEYVQGLLDQLPDGLIAQSLWAWDVCIDRSERPRVIEVNLAGFHPVRFPGFQCSGFFQDGAIGPDLLAELFAYVSEQYGVEVEVPAQPLYGIGDRPNFFEIIRRRVLARSRRSVHSSGVPLLPHRQGRIDAVLHLNERGVGRFAILKHSLERFLDRLGTCWIVAPDGDSAAIAERVGGPKFVVLAESEVLPEMANREPASPLCRSQAAKLAVAVRRVETDHWIDLTFDTIATRPVSPEELVIQGRSRWLRYLGPEQAEFYRTAERLLGSERSGFVYGDPPGVLCRSVAKAMVEALEARAPAMSWFDLLLGEPAWSLVSLYFTYLESLGLELRYHIATNAPFVGRAIWDEKEWPWWDVEAAFSPKARHAFTLLRIGHGVPLNEVWERVCALHRRPGLRRLGPGSSGLSRFESGRSHNRFLSGGSGV